MTGFRRAIDGIAAIEFALIMPALAAMLVPVVDLGMAFYQKMQVQNAAQAGAQYALAHGWNSTAIQNAVTSASSLAALSASPAPSQSCGCPNGTAITPTSCGAACTNGRSAGTYVTVHAKASYAPLVNYPFLGGSMQLAATSIVRID